MPTARISTACLLAILLLAFGPVLALAQNAPPARPLEGGELMVQAYAFKHQVAAEALPMVQPLLTSRGTVELQPGSNTLVIRDTRAAISRIVPVLRNFDHPARPVQLEMLIVKASRSPVSPPYQRSDLPDELTQRLRGILPYDIFELQARSRLGAMEGQAVAYSVGAEYDVTFRLGTMTGDGRIRLSNFRLSRRKAATEKGPAAVVGLLHTNLNLWLDQTLNLMVSRNESSPEALMIVLTPRRGDPRQP
jgi:hypothetical protein